MNNSKKIVIIVMTMLVNVLYMNAAQAVDQVKVQPHHMLMARRAAELDAYRLMTERIMGLKLNANSTVKNFAGQSDKIVTSMSNFIKGIRIDEEQTRWFDDGSCGSGSSRYTVAGDRGA